MGTAYLSEEWASALTDALNADAKVTKAIKGQNVVLQLTVNGAPDGDVDYAMRFEGGQARIALGKAERSDVQGTITYDNSVAMSKGELAGQTAVMTGKLAVQGDLEKVLKVGVAMNSIPEISQTLDISY